MKGLLTLIPTPLKEDLPLEPIALALLQRVSIDPNVTILVEEHKVARQRWLKWGLPREVIERFVLFNEHTVREVEAEILEKLKSGKEAVLFSDGGLPAFCDPGQSLVNRCHEKSIKVTSTRFPIPSLWPFH
jgi:16S rRNA (cytidine1402-2'-O)-methyltransferase